MSSDADIYLERLRQMRSQNSAAFQVASDKIKNEQAIEAKNNNINNNVLGKLEQTNQQIQVQLYQAHGHLLQTQGHLQHVRACQEIMSQAISDLKKNSADMKKAIETLKKQQQVAGPATPTRSNIVGLRSLSRGILQHQNLVESTTSPFELN